MYIYIEKCILRQQVIIQTSFLKDDGTLFIIFKCSFSSLLVIFLGSESKVVKELSHIFSRGEQNLWDNSFIT